MKQRIGWAIVVLVMVLGAASTAAAQGPLPGPRGGGTLFGNGFTYQGQLSKNNSPVNGTCDLGFSLWSADTNGIQIGSTLTQTLSVSSGLFTSDPLDFGATAFNGDTRYLAMAVQCSGDSSATPLGSRQLLSATPYALYAKTATTAGSATMASSLSGNLSGDVTSVGMNTTVTKLRGANISTSAPSNMSVLTYLGSQWTPMLPPADFDWHLAGNSVIDPATQFIGTTDAVTLTARVNNVVGWRLIPSGTNTPNIIGGLGDNRVTPGVFGAMIGGGGESGTMNHVTDKYGTVGGGTGNQAGDSAGTATDQPYATVGGGNGNRAGAWGSTVAGGIGNWADGPYSFVGGGSINRVSAMNGAIAGGSTNSIPAAGIAAAIGGGDSNTASGSYSTVPGGKSNSATMYYALAAGFRAKANHNGTFVWGDFTDADFTSTGDNQFLVRASGGVGINTSALANGGLQVAKDINGVAGYGQIEATGTLSPTKRLTLGFDTGFNHGWIQASETGVAYRDLLLNPNGGNVLIGTISGSDRVTVIGDIRIGNSGSNGCLKNFSGSALTGSCSSDARLKKDIVRFPSMIAEVNQLQPVHYSWRADEFPEYGFAPDERSFGLIAQEVEQVLPELVGVDERGYKTVNYSELPLVLLQALKDLRAEKDSEIAVLKTEISTLEEKQDSFETRLNALEHGTTSQSSPINLEIVLLGFTAISGWCAFLYARKSR